MQIEDHWKKAMRLEAARMKLNATDDYELVVWCCIHGGAQLANIVLHKLGVTDPAFDLIHSNIPEHNLKGPPPMSELLATLKTIEDLGPRFVRGIEPMDTEVVNSCLAAYAKVRGYAKLAMNQEGSAA